MDDVVGYPNIDPIGSAVAAQRMIRASHSTGSTKHPRWGPASILQQSRTVLNHCRVIIRESTAVEDSCH